MFDYFLVLKKMKMIMFIYMILNQVLIKNNMSKDWVFTIKLMMNCEINSKNIIFCVISNYIDTCVFALFYSLPY